MKRSRKRYTQDEIDATVIAEAEDLDKWSDPIQVKPKKVVVLHLDSTTIERAKQIVRTKRLRNYERWFEKIIRKEVSQAQKKRVSM